MKSETYARIAKDFNDLAAGGAEDRTGRIQLFGDLAYMFSLFAAENPTVDTAVSMTASTYNGTIRVDASGGARVISLLSASFMKGSIIRVKKIDASANTVTIDPSGAETIDGAATKVLAAQYQSITIQSNGTSWDVL